MIQTLLKPMKAGLIGAKVVVSTNEVQLPY